MKFTTAVGLLWSVSTAASFAVHRQPALARRNNKLAFSSVPNALVVGRGGDQSKTVLSATVSSGMVTEENLKVLSERGRKAVENLLAHDTDGAQAHVYGGWPEVGVEDEGKQKLAEQVRIFHCMSVDPPKLLMLHPWTACGFGRILPRRFGRISL